MIQLSEAVQTNAVRADARPGLWTFGACWLSLLASSSTLLCCALPTLLVAIGAGAALSSLISVIPGLVWISEYKTVVFGGAALMLAASGLLQWRNRSAPCPVDPRLRQACLATRKTSARIYLFSLAAYLVGSWFAFIQPWLQS